LNITEEGVSVFTGSSNAVLLEKLSSKK